MTTTRKVAIIVALLIANPAHGIVAELGGKIKMFTDSAMVLKEIIPGSADVLVVLTGGKVATGDVFVWINSPGGNTAEGDKIYAELRRFAGGHKLVCLGEKEVASMAFNLLSTCDERYGTPGTEFMMHDPYFELETKKKEDRYFTIRRLRYLIDDLELSAKKYRIQNAKALGLSIETINAMCVGGDNYFKTEELISNGYLSGYGRVVK